MNVLPACMSVLHVPLWCLQESEEGHWFPWVWSYFKPLF